MLKKLKLIHADRHQTTRELADTVGLSNKVCLQILTENLNLRNITVKFILRLLTNEQKLRNTMCHELQEKANMAPYDRFVPKIENETEGTQF
jgi:hypothetical protein